MTLNKDNIPDASALQSRKNAFDITHIEKWGDITDARDDNTLILVMEVTDIDPDAGKWSAAIIGDAYLHPASKVSIDSMADFEVRRISFFTQTQLRDNLLKAAGKRTTDDLDNLKGKKFMISYSGTTPVKGDKNPMGCFDIVRL